MSRNDVVLEGPEDIHFLIPVFHTANACCGAATAYLLRRIAYRAGAYAPGIQEAMFHELHTARDGGSLEKVQRWFASRVSSLHALGYRLQCRRVAIPTAALLDWVRAGKGYRGAMLPTDFKRLHPEPGAAGQGVLADGVAHAVGITIDRLDAKADEGLVMIDPWPGVAGGKDRRTAPTTSTRSSISGPAGAERLETNIPGRPGIDDVICGRLEIARVDQVKRPSASAAALRSVTR
jgi:hypothetical protein